MEFELSPLWISLKTAFVATILAFIAGITIAGWMFHYQGRGRSIIDGILTLPLVLPPTVVGFLLLLLFGRNSPVGQLLSHFGITIIFSWSAAVIASTVVAFPLMYKTVLGAFRQVDRDLINAARTLGASESRIFWQILLPLAWPGVIAGTVLSFARALGEFGATLMLAGSIPGRTQTMPIAIFFSAEAGKMGEALTWVLIMVAIAVGSIAAINHWSDSLNLAQTRLATSCAIIINRCSTIVERWLAVSGLKFKWLPFKPRRQGHRHLKTGTPSIAAVENTTVDHDTRDKSTELQVGLHQDLGSFKLHIDFEVAQEPLGILGASGSGKSMTLRCIAGLVTPEQGQIVLNGRVLFDADRKINIPSRQRHVGFVFQNYALFPHMRVARNIGFGLQDLTKEERWQRVEYYLKLMHLEGLEMRYPHELSGGQQQRVALARALATQPEALLLDEPLSALDSYLRRQIEQLLAEVVSTYEGVMLLVTHKLEEAYRICPNLLVLSGGRAIAKGRKEDIFERPNTLTVAQLTECKNISAIRPISAQQIEALDWGCTLQIIEPLTESLAYVGVRAHHLSLPELGSEYNPNANPNAKLHNTFLCWLVTVSEAPHHVTLYLKLDNGKTEDEHTYHLQVEVSKDKWITLKNRPLPWPVYLDPVRLILMES